MAHSELLVASWGCLLEDCVLSLNQAKLGHMLTVSYSLLPERCWRLKLVCFLPLWQSPAGFLWALRCCVHMHTRHLGVHKKSQRLCEGVGRWGLRSVGVPCAGWWIRRWGIPRSSMVGFLMGSLKGLIGSAYPLMPAESPGLLLPHPLPDPASHAAHLPPWGGRGVRECGGEKWASLAASHTAEEGRSH